VLAYQRRYPTRVRLLLSERNLRNNQIVARGIQAAQGRYVALLDGDDYWTSPDKLQKQVDFLDAHPDCAVCFHNATVVYEDGSRAPRHWTPVDQKPVATLEDIWLGNFIATCATMFRRGLWPELPSWYDALFPITDWPLHILNAEHGHLGYLNEVMGVYRYHSGGLYSPLSEARKLAETLQFYRVMNRNLHYKYDGLVNTAISKYFLEWAEAYAARGDLVRARACFRTCLGGRPLNRFISARRLLSTGCKVYAPFGLVHRRCT
jgi:glycosyltransferase involved in cell wall biosynthesis